MTVTSNTPSLFTPIKVGNLTLQHRVAMAPLTRFRTPNHIPPAVFAEYYEQRAIRPGTLIIAEATLIAANAGGYDGSPGIWSQEQINGWKHVTDKIHAKGSFVYIQLLAVGRLGLPEALERDGATTGVVSASNVPTKASGVVPRPATKEEIKEYIQLYVQAAKNALEAGADGVEIHNSNGYFPDQFLHENTNHRTDEYGGSIENRARFTLEIIDALTEAIGPEKLAIRFSPWATYGEVEPGLNTVPQWSYVISELEKRAQQGKRLAYLHVIESRVDGYTDSDSTESVEFVRDIWQGILFRAGGLTETAEEVAEKDPKLVVALGRYFISNPDLVDRLEKKIALTPYDRSKFYATDPYDITGYIEYKTASQ